MSRRKKVYRTISNPGWHAILHELFVGKKNLPVIYYQVDRFVVPYKRNNEWLKMEFDHFMN